MLDSFFCPVCIVKARKRNSILYLTSSRKKDQVLAVFGSEGVLVLYLWLSYFLEHKSRVILYSSE